MENDVPKTDPRPPMTHYRMGDLLGQPVLIAKIDDREYLFPPEILSLAADLLTTDLVGLAEAGAGVEITPLSRLKSHSALAQVVRAARDRRDTATE
jgi:hypothetical protein